MEAIIKKSKYFLLDLADELMYQFKKISKVLFEKIMDIVEPKVKEVEKSMVEKLSAKLASKLKSTLKKALILSAACALVSVILLIVGKKK